MSEDVMRLVGGGAVNSNNAESSRRQGMEFVIEIIMDLLYSIDEQPLSRGQTLKEMEK